MDEKYDERDKKRREKRRKRGKRENKSLNDWVPRKIFILPQYVPREVFTKYVLEGNNIIWEEGRGVGWGEYDLFRKSIPQH